jgi:hypothetical protein
LSASIFERLPSCLSDIPGSVHGLRPIRKYIYAAFGTAVKAEAGALFRYVPVIPCHALYPAA